MSDLEAVRVRSYVRTRLQTAQVASQYAGSEVRGGTMKRNQRLRAWLLTNGLYPIMWRC
jgi:hypothetical protein